MQSIPRVVALALTLSLAACAARTTNISSGGEGAVPPLPPGVMAPKWDHYCAFFGGGRGGDEAFGAMLDEASANHWEMVSAVPADTTVLVCFKRPADLAPPAPPAPPAP